MGDQVIKLNLQQLSKDDMRMKSIDWLKKEILETFRLRNPAGLKPLLWHLVLKGRILQPSETLNSALAEYSASDTMDANVDRWVPVPLLESYQAFCMLYQQDMNAKLVNVLTESQSLEDKICAFSCDLDDNSAWPLLMALSGSVSFSHLDLSHNFLGSQSMDKIQKLIAASNQPNLGLILDLHKNNLGAVSIAQICECPVTRSRLEVLNLSDNKLTDAAARFIANLIENSQALEVLKLQNCSLTTRSILKLSAALQSSCPLVKLSIGKNNPVSSAAIAGLLDKLACLNNFLELDLTGIILDKEGAEVVSRLIKSSKLLVEDSLSRTEDPHAIGVCSRMIVKRETSVCDLPNGEVTIWTAHLPQSCPHCADLSTKCLSCLDNEQDFQ
ncbi:hypothetical protein L7F22_046490 [Adiantum nelumboides]|nr:hypothetical protein [Adiantum nelumboides]